MKAAILTIGDELTCGYRLDTNSQAISLRLAVLPADVVLHVSTGDDAAMIHRSLRQAMDVAGVVIVTGGLGPTEDDLTRQVIADCFDLPLVEDAEALARIRQRFSRYGRTMPESNRIQAQVPAGSRIIHNDRGTAAGFYLPVDGKHIFVTPGIPYEMLGMLEGFILPRLRRMVEHDRHVRRAALKVYGLAESRINDMIRPLLARGRNPLLGLLPHRGTITVEIVAAGATQQEAERLMEADLATLRDVLGQHVISEDGRDLPQVVADLLLDRNLTIATAELGTGGLVAARLTQAEDSGRFLRRSTVGLPPACPAGDRTGQATAEALAAAARDDGGSDVGVGVSAIDVPADSSAERPYGQVHVAVDVQGEMACRRFSFNGDRVRVQYWAADAALALVRLQMMSDR